MESSSCGEMGQIRHPVNPPLPSLPISALGSGVASRALRSARRAAPWALCEARAPRRVEHALGEGRTTRSGPCALEDDVAALAPPPTQQPAPRRGPHAHERPRTQTQADATDRAASTERPHQHTTQSAPRAVRWCRRAGPFETDTRARAGLSVPAPSPSVPHAPQPPSLMVRESAQK